MYFISSLLASRTFSIGNIIPSVLVDLVMLAPLIVDPFLFKNLVDVHLLVQSIFCGTRGKKYELFGK